MKLPQAGVTGDPTSRKSIQITPLFLSGKS